ncbi:unnamed protein product, partial [Brassica oleracea]
DTTLASIIGKVCTFQLRSEENQLVGAMTYLAHHKIAQKKGSP